MEFNKLIINIKTVDNGLKSQANKSVNQLLTIRNWLVGYYIVEYEQNGKDRAEYGKKLLQTLSERLNKKGFSFRNLKLFRQFYFAFPEIGQLLTAQSGKYALPALQLFSNINGNIIQSNDFQDITIRPLKTAQFKSPKNAGAFDNPKDQLALTYKIIQSLSFTHISLLLSLNDKLKRTFYAIESIQGVWSVNELKRQISTLLFERSGLSKNPKLLIDSINKNIQTPHESQLVKDVYTFEFLGLPVANALEETDLETALLDHLREFILELGNGFCLEARQKRILIGEQYYFIDLVFYHRILKCHVLIELKVNDFEHTNPSQLNTYINYFKKEIQEKNDNPPVGILLVTNKDQALVEYATAGMDENLFVSKYLLQLPDKRKLENFIKNELKRL